jgi:hypothetical protein
MEMPAKSSSTMVIFVCVVGAVAFVAVPRPSVRKRSGSGVVFAVYDAVNVFCVSPGANRQRRRAGELHDDRNVHLAVIAFLNGRKLYVFGCEPA